MVNRGVWRVSAALLALSWVAFAAAEQKKASQEDANEHSYLPPWMQNQPGGDLVKAPESTAPIATLAMPKEASRYIRATSDRAIRKKARIGSNHRRTGRSNASGYSFFGGLFN